MGRDEFWTLTVRELYRAFAAENARRRDHANRDARLAWNIVSMYGYLKSKRRMPKLENYLVSSNSGKAQSSGALKGSLRVLSEQYNIPVGQTRLIRKKKP